MDIPRFGENEDIESKFNDLAKKAAEYLKSEYYILPWETDEKGKKYLFLPTLLTNGTLLKVLEEDIEYLGFN